MEPAQIIYERNNFYHYLACLSNWGIITKEEHDRFKTKVDDTLETMKDR